ncbi:hypothetical protein LTS18_014633, partial [Coniosporium uncinatum]
MQKFMNKVAGSSSLATGTPTMPAFDPPLGPIFAQCRPEPVTLQMKEKVLSLSGDDFTVQTVSGVNICKVKGKVISISGKK